MPRAPLGYPGEIEHFNMMREAVGPHVVGVTPGQKVIYTSSVIEPAAQVCRQLGEDHGLSAGQLRGLLFLASADTVFDRRCLEKLLTGEDQYD